MIACPSCSCHAKPHEVECPHCGAQLRRSNGSVPLTAVALTMGLTTIAGASLVSCSDDSGAGGAGGGEEPVPLYGPAPTGAGGGGG